jgi:hypothetical protein
MLNMVQHPATTDRVVDSRDHKHGKARCSCAALMGDMADSRKRLKGSIATPSTRKLNTVQHRAVEPKYGFSSTFEARFVGVVLGYGRLETRYKTTFGSQVRTSKPELDSGAHAGEDRHDTGWRLCRLRECPKRANPVSSL